MGLISTIVASINWGDVAITVGAWVASLTACAVIVAMDPTS